MKNPVVLEVRLVFVKDAGSDDEAEQQRCAERLSNDFDDVAAVSGFDRKLLRLNRGMQVFADTIQSPDYSQPTIGNHFQRSILWGEEARAVVEGEGANTAEARE